MWRQSTVIVNVVSAPLLCPIGVVVILVQMLADPRLEQ